MKNEYLVMDARDSEAIKRASRSVTTWDPLLSLRVSSGDALYGGILTSYGLCIGQEVSVAFRDRVRRVHPGDAIVLPPSVRLASQPPGDFFWICYEGLAPAHLRGAAGVATGFEHFSLDRALEDRSICGNRRQVLPADDLRYRVQYHHVEIENAEPHTHSDMVELYYVLSGTGEIRIGVAQDKLTPVPIHAGQLILVGPGLYHIPSNGLGMCVWFLYNEQAHRRRVRDASSTRTEVKE